MTVTAARIESRLRDGVGVNLELYLYMYLEDLEDCISIVLVDIDAQLYVVVNKGGVKWEGGHMPP